VDFALYIDDSEFDNFDNEYAELKLHRYTNMESKSDTYADELDT